MTNPSHTVAPSCSRERTRQEAGTGNGRKATDKRPGGWAGTPKCRSTRAELACPSRHGTGEASSGGGGGPGPAQMWRQGRDQSRPQACPFGRPSQQRYSSCNPATYHDVLRLLALARPPPIKATHMPRTMRNEPGTGSPVSSFLFIFVGQVNTCPLQRPNMMRCVTAVLFGLVLLVAGLHAQETPVLGGCCIELLGCLDLTQAECADREGQFNSAPCGQVETIVKRPHFM